MSNINSPDRRLLEITFGGSKDGAYIYYLRCVARLASHYCEEEMPDAARQAMNQLFAYLNQCELWSEFRCTAQAIAEINKAENDVEADDADGLDATLFSKLLCCMEESMRTVKDMDFAALILFIKKKAIEAGNYPLNQED